MAKVETRKITDFRPDPSNANQGTERGLRILDNSLAEVGLGRSAVADKNGILIAGNKTQERSVDSGFEDAIVVHTTGKQLVVVQRDDLDLLDDNPNNLARRMAYYDNVTSQHMAWDAAQIAADVEDGVNLDAMFTPAELDDIYAGLDTGEPVGDPGAQIDKAAELQEKWQVKKGDLWIIGKHRLLCGDSTNADDVARVMGGEKADAVVTDPPYGINATKMTLGTGKKEFHRGEWDNERPDISNLLNIAPVLVVWGGNYFTDILPMSNDWLCWHKKNDGLSFSEFELAWTNAGCNCRILSHHWSGEIKDHPTQKPLEVILWCMGFVKGIAIYDPFGGSGTTMAACEQLSRQCRMIEIAENYCAVILERMSGMGLMPQLEMDS